MPSDDISTPLLDGETGFAQGGGHFGRVDVVEFAADDGAFGVSEAGQAVQALIAHRGGVGELAVFVLGGYDDRRATVGAGFASESAQVLTSDVR